MIGILTKIIGSKNEREIKKLWVTVEKINSLEPLITQLDDASLKAKTDEFRKRLQTDETPEDILPEAFAVVRETSCRILAMRHFDVQLIGGIVLHNGRIAEMKTGEGKTLAATLAVYLNALDGHGVHIITVNDYLAKRDTQWMGPIYDFLGLSVGVIQHDASFMYDPSHHSEDRRLQKLRLVTRQEAYNADITYGTNNEFGFDYLRDNMNYDLSHYVQRELNYAIVDEVDSILIDESRTPLIISGPSEESTDKYYKIDKIIPKLRKDTDFSIDEKARSVMLSDEGNIKVEKLLAVGNLYDPSNIELVHHVNQGLRAHALFKRDVDYIVKDNEVLIVDEFTGRLMPGRRWSDGLHQAIEAKEGVKIASENQTLATITFQNYFRMYKKLAGMTGTADTEAEEFAKIYNLDVMVIPTNQPMIRADYADIIYKTEKAKFNSVVNEIEDCYKRGQPVLVGTISIEKSELLSSILKKKGIKHSVLNAKYHEKEAEIISSKEEYEDALTKAQELCKKDREKVIASDGVHILGTERHEARRIDNQLRGRSGRQGDAGTSRFYLSLEDDLMRIFGSERISGLMGKLGMDESQPIEHRWISKAIENAQKKVEAHNFDIRKHLLEYDDVMNMQRTEIYIFRREILTGDNLKEKILKMAEEVLEGLLSIYCPEDKHPEEWDINGLKDALFRDFSIHPVIDAQPLEELRHALSDEIKTAYENKEKEIGTDALRYIEKVILLQVVDTQWKDHLLGMDHLKEGIGLRGYGQRDPLVEYKKEAFEAFSELSGRIESEVVSRLFKIQIAKEEDARRKVMLRPAKIRYNKGNGGEEKPQTVVKDKKIGRNDPCICGSGKKYKKCCGMSYAK
jgi:preprotein translocase subunit SecA